jgi:hypothetical protein
MRSPLGSVDNTVGCPLVVFGKAAQMASGYILARFVVGSILEQQPDVRDILTRLVEAL